MDAICMLPSVAAQHDFVHTVDGPQPLALHCRSHRPNGPPPKLAHAIVRALLQEHRHDFHQGLQVIH